MTRTSRRPHPLPLIATLAAAVVAGAGGLALTAGQASAASTQLLTNSGFESGSLTGWNCSAADKVSTSPVSDGSYALTGTPQGSDDAQCAQTISVQPGSTYTLSARVQGSFVYLGATGTGTTDPSTWTSSASWTDLTTSFTTGPSTTSVSVWVHGWYGQGAFSVDTLSLTGPAGSGGTPPPTSPPPTSPPPSGSADTAFQHPSYFMPLDNSPQSIQDIVSGSGEKEFLLAFVLDSGGCNPAWDGDSAHAVGSDATVASDVTAIRNAGGDVSVSFGGYNGTELGATCGGSAGMAAAYQKVIDAYHLTRIDLDWEGDDLDANMAVRWGAIKTLEQNNPGLKVTLTIPMTTVGLPDTGKDEIRQAIADGARIDVVNIMDFDFGLTSGTETDAAETVANDVNTQLQSLYGWDSATAWGHTSIQLMNGHTDQPSELFTQDTFNTLLAFARGKHAAAFTYWDVNRDRTCDPSVPHNWADGACSSVTQNTWDFTKIVTQYNG